jgi:hypothetical protein
VPSSGYGLVNLGLEPDDPADKEQCEVANSKARHLIDCAHSALTEGLFVEWLSAFMAAWEKTKDVTVAANAGMTEWDL